MACESNSGLTGSAGAHAIALSVGVARLSLAECPAIRMRRAQCDRCQRNVPVKIGNAGFFLRPAEIEVSARPLPHGPEVRCDLSWKEASLLLLWQEHKQET